MISQWSGKSEERQLVCVDETHLKHAYGENILIKFTYMLLWTINFNFITVINASSCSSSCYPSGPTNTREPS